ncbi:MAG: hypothetical protein Q9162_000804 [Coniocarpon cinnabarinum]
MPQSEEAAAWFAAVYETIQKIPHGRVTTYGHIAMLVGTPERPRQVGVALKHLPSHEAAVEFHNQNVPWQRVINAKGTVTPRGREEAGRQAAALEAEGVEVTRGSLGEYQVDFARFGWFPESVD